MPDNDVFSCPGDDAKGLCDVILLQFRVASVEFLFVHEVGDVRTGLPEEITVTNGYENCIYILNIKAERENTRP